MTATQAAELLIGTWALVAYDVRDADGSRYQPLGPDPLGLLIYGADGHMSAQLTRRIEASTTGASRLAADAIAYSGTYDVDEAGASVAHHVIVSLAPEWAGHTLRRAIHLDEDLLLLTARMSAPDGAVSLHELSWRRITRD
jgi:hypothetical protein